MATDVSQLSRIAALVDRLGPLGGKRPGMPIAADDWNALVDVLGAMLEVERAQERMGELALEGTTSAKNRLDTVDNELAGLLGDGGSSVSARLTVADVQKKVDALGADVGRLTARGEDQQRLVDRATASELERAADLRGLEGRFKSVEDLRGVMTKLSADVVSIRRSIKLVLELSKRLSDAQGNPIDVEAMRNEVVQLDALRENLTGVDGTLLRARDLELRIKELEDSQGGAGLDARIAAAVGALREELAKRADEQIASSVPTAATAAVEAALANLDERIVAILDRDIGPAVARAIDALGLDARFTDLETKLTNDFQARADALDQRFQALLRRAVATLDQKFTAALTALDARVKRLETLAHIPPPG